MTIQKLIMYIRACKDLNDIKNWFDKQESDKRKLLDFVHEVADKLQFMEPHTLMDELQIKARQLTKEIYYSDYLC